MENIEIVKLSHVDVLSIDLISGAREFCSETLDCIYNMTSDNLTYKQLFSAFAACNSIHICKV